MLANYNDMEKWLSILNSKVWDLEEETERVQKSLELSFDNLPNSIVKQCFAYCSIFEKDTVMKRKHLIRLWMALGLVQADEARNKEMEDVGIDIFQILVSNSLFQMVNRDSCGYVTRCSMHDLSLSLSKHESLSVVGATKDDISGIGKVKHLSFYQMFNENYEFEVKVSMLFERDTLARTLHTLFFNRGVEKNFSFQQFKCMRILKLKGIDEIDNSIGELGHLRYLNLSFSYDVVLPKSIGKLYHLQTLKLKGCNNLKKFPESMRNLISLRYFKCDRSIPINILGQWTSLRTLKASFSLLRKKGHEIEELSRLKHLSGTLCISDLENVSSKEDAVKANLCGKKDLYEIAFNWNSRDDGAHGNDKDVLEGLQPPRGVKILSIDGFSDYNFPEWLMKMGIYIDGRGTPLDKLVKIKLENCSSCISLPMLEHLPHLRDLVLWSMDSLIWLRSSIGECDEVTRSTKPLSPSLRSLELFGMKSLEKWIDGAPNSSKMISPVLETLGIYSCPKISLLDECHSHPLVSLRIGSCIGLVSIKSIQGLTSLESLDISRCPSMLGITNLPNQCRSLKSLCITNCDKLTSLHLEMFNWFAFLEDLELGPFSEELDSFPSLQGIEQLRNHLQKLKVRGWDHWESMPEEIQHLTSLTHLEICEFGIRELPRWLIDMSSIQVMEFTDCERLDLDEEEVKRGAPHRADEIILNGRSVYR